MTRSTATHEELQHAHDRVRRILPPLAKALASPALAAALELGAAMRRNQPAARIDRKRIAAGDRGED